MKKNIGIIILILISLSASATIAWHLFVSKPDPRQQTANSSTFLNKFSGTLSGNSAKTLGNGPVSLGKRPAVSLVQARDSNKVMYYERETGNVLSIRADGNDETLVSSAILKSFAKTIWSRSTAQVISVFSEKTGKRFTHYSYTSKKSTPLPAGTELATFSPDGTAYAYLQRVGDAGTIFITSPGSTPKKILTMRATVKDIAWPQKDLLSLVVQDSQTQTNALFTLTTDGKLERITDFWEDLEVVWSHQGTVALVSLKDFDGIQQLFRKELGGKEIGNIEAPARAHQCAWSIDGITVICGIDKQVPMGDVNAVVTQDFYEINTETGDARAIFSSTTSKPFAVEEITLSQLEDSFVFINAFDHKVYGIKKPSS